MWPLLFHSGPWALQTYSVLMSLAFFVALFTWFHTGKRYSFQKESLVSLSIGAFVWGLVGARLLYIATRWEDLLSGKLQPWAIWEGGIVFLGGFIAAVVFLYIRFPHHNMSRLKGFNSACAPIAFAHAVGRLGCFFNGCCYGSVCPYPWAVTYTRPESAAWPLDTPLHPTQLYESFGLIVLGILCLKWERHASLKGKGAFNNGKKGSLLDIQTYEVYLGGYSVLRFFNEFFRGDEIRGIGWLGLSTSQWLCFAIAVFLIARRWKTSQSNK